MANEQSPQAGVAVDARGRDAIDPSKNVEDMVRALEAKLAELRITDQRHIDARFDALEKMQDFARNSIADFQNFARDAEARTASRTNDAETRRIDQLAQTRQEFQNTIRDMLAESVRTTSSLVSTQLVQIQATFDTRVTKLEASQLTQAGRSSVADPAIEVAMGRLTSSLSSLSAEMAAMRSSESGTGGRASGREDAGAQLKGVLLVIASIASPVIALIAIFALKGH